MIKINYTLILSFLYIPVNNNINPIKPIKTKPKTTIPNPFFVNNNFNGDTAIITIRQKIINDIIPPDFIKLSLLFIYFSQKNKKSISKK